MGQMKEYKNLLKELPSRTIVFAFGRFNPPTIGHELLVKSVVSLAQRRRADHVIFASRSVDNKKNPLPVDKKVKYLNQLFPRVNFAAASNDARTFLEVAKLLNKKYKNIIMVAGSDRVPEFTRLLNQYNGKDFNYDTVQVVSAGARDPDSDGADGMSASKMREAAAAGRFEDVKNKLGFRSGLPKTMREIDARRLMNDVRHGMGLSPVREHIELPKDDIRELYFQEKIFNVGDLVESNEQVYEIVKRGSNHLLLKNQEGNLESKWIHDVKELKMNEELTDKTLRKTDKIKVARMIAMMLGVAKPESSSNPENLVNMGLRKIRTKALNPESVRLVGQILDLAKQMEIKYDATLVPTKLKEEKTDRVVPVDKSKKNNMAGDILSYKDFKKIDAMKGGYKEEVKTKETESDLDAENADAETHTATGGLMSQPYGIKDDNHRRRVVKYHLGEAEDPAAKAAEKAAKETAKAQLSVKHAKEKEQLSIKHANDREKLKSESTMVSFKTHIEEESLEENAAVRKKAVKSGVSYGTLIKVYRRGVAAWNSGHRPGTTPEQWGLARVNSYITKGKGTYHGADKDLREDSIDEMKRVPKDEESGEPKKYVAGLSKSTAKARAAHWDKMDKKSDKDPEAYKPAPGDKDAKTKESKHTKAYRAKFGEEVVELESLMPFTEIMNLAKAKMGDVIKDFQDSDAPQFKGKSKEKKREMAIAAKLQADDDSKLKEETEDDVRAYEKDINITDFSDSDIDSLINDLTDDDYLEEYDEDELALVDDETGEEIEADEEEKSMDEEHIVEVLSRAERMKSKFRIRKTKAKRARSTKIALKKFSPTATINKRARRLAVKALKKRLLRGRNPNKLSVAEKERVEKIIQNKKPLLKRIAMKLAPQVRKREKARMSHTKFTQGKSSVF